MEGYKGAGYRRGANEGSGHGGGSRGGGGNWYDRVGSKGVDMDGTEAAELGRADSAVSAEWWDGKRGEKASSPRMMQIYGADIVREAEADPGHTDTARLYV